MTTAAVTNHERSPVGERVMAGGVSTAQERLPRKRVKGRDCQLP